jgi:hypothetical protein
LREASICRGVVHGLRQVCHVECGHQILLGMSLGLCIGGFFSFTSCAHSATVHTRSHYPPFPPPLLYSIGLHGRVFRSVAMLFMLYLAMHLSMLQRGHFVTAVATVVTAAIVAALAAGCAVLRAVLNIECDG